jgi:hypothetical protein
MSGLDNASILKYSSTECSIMGCGLPANFKADATKEKGIADHLNAIFAPEIHEVSQNISAGTQHHFSGNFGSQVLAAAVASIKPSGRA